jgi:hypothetical protein
MQREKFKSRGTESEQYKSQSPLLLKMIFTQNYETFLRLKKPKNHSKTKIKSKQ